MTKNRGDNLSLNFKFYDVNLGNCTLIQTEKLNILFDIGTNEITGKNPLFSFNGQLDLLIITHPHKDHISGLIDIENKIPKTLLRNKSIPHKLINDAIELAQSDTDEKIFKKYLELDKKYDQPTSHETNPCNPYNNGNINISNFLPSKNDIKDLNYYSISTLFEYDGYKILLMGDNTPSNIDELLDNKQFIEKTKNIDILLAPHHGRMSSYKSELVKHLNPILTIISDTNGQDEVSAVNYYSSKSRGMNVFKNGFLVERSCLTTRNDGTIHVKIENGNLYVFCEKR